MATTRDEIYRESESFSNVFFPRIERPRNDNLRSTDSGLSIKRQNPPNLPSPL